MKAVLFWDMTPCPDVSKYPVAFVILALGYSRTSPQLYGRHGVTSQRTALFSYLAI